MNNPESLPVTRRRTLLKAAAWTTPVIVAASAAPAYAASPPNQQFGVVFDGTILGANGYFSTMYLNLRAADSVGEFRSTAPVSVTIDVVGLLPNARNERTFTASSSDGSIQRSPYDASTQTTRLVWTIPSGTLFPAANTSSAVPDILFNFGGGASPDGRITNKVVVRSIACGRIVQPTSTPVDSSVVRDFVQSRPSPDGIY